MTDPEDRDADLEARVTELARGVRALRDWALDETNALRGLIEDDFVRATDAADALAIGCLVLSTLAGFLLGLVGRGG